MSNQPIVSGPPEGFCRGVQVDRLVVGWPGFLACLIIPPPVVCRPGAWGFAWGK